jgi:outer membrane protein assembly factor BamB
MKLSELVFIGIRGSVLAVNRSTGRQVWAAPLKGAEFVNVILDSGGILATTCGEIFCLDPFTGKVLWHNPLKGFGRGLSSLATEATPAGGVAVLVAEKSRREQEAAAAAATASA